jgi:hypothetical protein
VKRLTSRAVPVAVLLCYYGMASVPFTMSMKITYRNSFKSTYNRVLVAKLKAKLLRKQTFVAVQPREQWHSLL